MNLRRLKKQLKRQEKKARKNKPRRWIWLVFLLPVLVVALLPVYNQRQLDAPQRLYNQAVKLESLGKVEAAQQLYMQLYQDYPRSGLAAQSLLQSGKIWQYDRRRDRQALLAYLQLEHDFPDHPLVRTAQLAAARIVKYSLRDYFRAISFYQRLREQPGGDQDQYLYEIADCYFRLDNYTQARIELDTLLEKFPQSPLLPDMLYRRGGLLLLENRLSAAQEDWQRLIEQFPDSSYSLQARFNLAKMLEEDDRLLEALDLYRQLESYPRPALLQEKIKHLKKRIAEKKKAI